MSTCPQCGAWFPEDETCGDRFPAAQVLEIERPPFYAVHHLSVPSFMLQHAAYSHRGWLAARALLREFVEDGLTPVQARRRMQRASGCSSRSWSYTRGPRPPGIEAVVWSRTIAGVRLEDARTYGADVRAWAEAILSDTQAYARELAASA